MSQPSQPAEDDEIESIELDITFVPESQNTINFRGRKLITATLKDGRGYIGLNSLADTFGISRPSMIKRLRRKFDFFSQYV